MSVRSPEDIRLLGTILGIWAHPDDETFMSGGLMAAAVQNGQRVFCVTATKGELGVQDENRWPSVRLADIRTEELRDAEAILGVKHAGWLELPDGGCKEANADTVQNKLVSIIKEVAPDSILTFGPDGMTGHTDHQAVSAWASKAGQSCGITVYHAVATPLLYQTYQDACKQAAKQHRQVNEVFFNIDQPPILDDASCDICLQLTDDIWHKKLEALKAMPSQTERLISQLGDDYFRLTFRNEAFVKANLK